MKRISLADFNVKYHTASTQQTDQLLGQVLGSCHDSSHNGPITNSGSDPGAGSKIPIR